MSAMTSNQIDFQGLLNVVKAAEAEPNLDMGAWRSRRNDCGTTNCMIGSFCAQNTTDSLRMDKTKPWKGEEGRYFPTSEHGQESEAIAHRFGITLSETRWLFSFLHRPWTRCEVAIGLSKEEAISRLRKFIYYKMHKNEMTYEEARNVDGNKVVVVAKERLLCLQS